MSGFEPCHWHPGLPEGLKARDHLVDWLYTKKWTIQPSSATIEIFKMQRRIDDPQRRPGDQYTPRLIPTGNQRFGEVNEGPAALSAPSMTFPISGYQLNQPGSQHHGPVSASLAHAAVGLGGPQGPGGGPGGGPPQSLHTQTAPGHPPNIPVNQPLTSAPMSGGGQQQQQQQFQRLKVEDALSYLDQVKLQFGNQPQVYNDFLDIMKEFKSQTIDTPGVINRVSNLFKGHPDLIVGFNTFLPPGYKIEVQCETINVHQPGQQVMSIAALAQSQAVSSVNRQRANFTIWDLANQASSNQKVGPVHHSGLPPAAPSSASDHRSYHQSPRPQPDSTTSASSGTPHSQQQQHPHQQQQQQSQQSQQSQQQQQQGGQPVEFNHAINYVNKIKQGGAGGPAKPLTESEVYQQVANLFKHQDDLLAEFGQFLPDANGGSSYGVASFVSTPHNYVDEGSGSSSGRAVGYQVRGPGFEPQYRPSQFFNALLCPPSTKWKKLPKDFSSLADASKTGSLTEYAFFDKVRKALRHQEVYDNFLRSIILFNQEIVTKPELVTLVSFFLSKFPDLFREFKDLLGVNEQGGGVEAVPHGATQKERIGGELAMEIDFNTCKRYGASYRGIPSKFVPPKCSGRTPLCKEVLNDIWVSFPTWSEDSSFVTSRKTQYEENIYKCEDERFELDYVIETNFSTIKCLEGVLKRMNRMSQDEAAKFRLDNSLGGTSECINRNSIQRIYGDKANDIIEGLKKNPVIAVPLVLRRLKAKDEEWREAQKQFNKLWKEQNEKFYLKSLDHQCANFKQHDIKAIRGNKKRLLCMFSLVAVFHFPTVFLSHFQRVDNEEAPPQGPMLTFTHEDRTLIEDAGNLIIHHVKRQTGVDKEAKSRIKVLVKHLVPDLFFAPRGELSDDDGEGNEDMDVDDDENNMNGQRTSETSKRAKDKPGTTAATTATTTTSTTASSSTTSSGDVDEKGKKKGINGVKKEPKEELGNGDEVEEEKGEKADSGSGVSEDDDKDRYTLFYCNTTWYIFLRLHQILCTRLLKAYTLTQKLIQEEELTKHERKESVAKALRLRTPLEADVQDYYSYFMDMVRAVLDGNMESSQYEDTMREMYGIDAFQLFTMDKLVQNVVRQVQHLVMDDMPSRLTKLFEEQRDTGGAGGRWATRHQRATLEQAYLRQAEIILGDENPFKFVIRSLTATMEIDMLDPPPESSPSVKETMTWSSYLKDFASGASGVGAGRKKEEFCHRVGNSRAIYLVRNKKRNPNWEDFKLREEASLKEEDEDEDDADDEGGETKNDQRQKLKEGGRDLEVKEEPMEEDGDVKGDKRKTGTSTESIDKDATSTKAGSTSTALGTGSAPTTSDTSSSTNIPQGKGLDQKEAEDQATSFMQDAATLASLSQGGRPLEEEDDEEEETRGVKRRVAGGGDSDGGLGDDEDDEEKELETAGGKRRKIGSSPDGTTRRLHSVDTTSVKFSHNSYHHVFVNKTGLIMFQPNRIARTNACHKQVTQHKFANMSAWTQPWVMRNVSSHQREECRRWLMGQTSDSRANHTSERTIDRPDRTPYRPFTRYCLDWVTAAAPANSGNGRSSSPQNSATGASSN
ncbi:paired amphipathic helix protein sin3a [Plakobranchus ocellatus]|uniref:Paired amphipathic helix protein sin3a n=1 Tax=Plakobranchus ocellatus TaxID=259542 RepID=A0AAV4D916_9GAST|nr:paired amphipathic helix protein sin3a [Plakobranchus ocellatus]